MEEAVVDEQAAKEKEAREKLRAIIAEVAELDDVPDGASFQDLGIDSMMAIEIVAYV